MTLLTLSKNLLELPSPSRDPLPWHRRSTPRRWLSTPAAKNHLPYDVVVERLHVDRPEPTPPEPAPTTEVEPEAGPGYRVAIPVNGEWQTFPNQRAAEQAAYQEYKDNLRRNAQNFHISDDHLGEGGPKAKYQANVAAI